MRKYWDEEIYSQPSESLLQNNARESLQKQQAKGKNAASGDLWKKHYKKLVG